MSIKDDIGMEGLDESTIKVMDVCEIMKKIPHRYPMLLVDKIYIVKSGEYSVGVKNVTANEQFFTGHFPGHPIMPGVMIIEAMAQASGLMVMDVLTEGRENNDKVVYFMSIDNAKFRRPVMPGDRMCLHVTVLKGRGNIWKMKGEAKVEGRLVAEAVFSAMIVDK